MLIASTAVFFGTGIAASTGSPSYSGEIRFGAPSLTTSCVHGAPREVTVSVPVDATRLTAAVSRQFAARFRYEGKTLAYLRTAGPIAVVIRPGERGPVSAHFSVPTDRTYNQVAIGLLNRGTAQSWERLALSCGSLPALPAPAVASVSHPCLATTSARVTNPSGRPWTLDAIVDGTRSATTTTIGAHSSATVRIGSALHGAERFTLVSTASTVGTSVTVALSDFDEACVRGHVHTSFTAVRQGAVVRLSVVERPILPAGTAVAFYQLIAGQRHLVGRAPLGPNGIATTTEGPYRSHTTFLAVIAPTHYSYATTTSTATVP